MFFSISGRFYSKVYSKVLTIDSDIYHWLSETIASVNNWLLHFDLNKYIIQVVRGINEQTVMKVKGPFYCNRLTVIEEEMVLLKK